MYICLGGIFTPWRVILAHSSAIFPYIKTLMLLILEDKLSESRGKKAKVIPITIPSPKQNRSRKRFTKQVDLQSLTLFNYCTNRKCANYRDIAQNIFHKRIKICSLQTSVQLEMKKTSTWIIQCIVLREEILSNHNNTDPIVKSSINWRYSRTEILINSLPRGLKQNSCCYFKRFLLFTVSMV